MAYDCMLFGIKGQVKHTNDVWFNFKGLHFLVLYLRNVHL